MKHPVAVPADGSNQSTEATALLGCTELLGGLGAVGRVWAGGSGGFLPLFLPAGAYWWDIPGVCAGRVDGPG